MQNLDTKSLQFYFRPFSSVNFDIAFPYVIRFHFFSKNPGSFTER